MASPYRIVAAPEVESHGEADAYEAGLRARASRPYRVGALVGVLVAVALGAFVARNAPHRSREAAEALGRARLAHYTRETIATTRAFAGREQAAFSATLIAAIDGDFAPAASACARQVAAPSSTLGKAGFPMLVVAKGDHDLPSPSLGPLLADVNRAEEQLRAGRTIEAAAAAGELAMRMQNTPRYGIVIVTTSMKHPLRTSPSSFEPGELSGRAYLYDAAVRRVVCESDVHAASSREIAYNYFPTSASASMNEGPRLSASLDDDLERQIRRAVAAGSLDAIGPR